MKFSFFLLLLYIRFFCFVSWLFDRVIKNNVRWCPIHLIYFLSPSYSVYTTTGLNIQFLHSTFNLINLPHLTPIIINHSGSLSLTLHCFLGPCHYVDLFLFSVNLLFVKRTVLKEINYRLCKVNHTKRQPYFQ